MFSYPPEEIHTFSTQSAPKLSINKT